MNSLEQIIRPDILKMSAYHVANLPNNCVKLDAMESPYELPDELKQELAQNLSNAPIRLYPNIATDSVIPQLKQVFAIPKNAEVALGNGSDELIQFITLLVASPNAKVMAIEPTFVMYRRNAELFGAKYIGVNTCEDFSLDIDYVIEQIKQHQPQLIFIAYPNNPTGIRYEKSDIEKIINTATGLVVIDEAYGSFSSDSWISQAGQIENLLVLRTFSKIGFAGLRVGYVSGCLKIIEQLRKILPPYNMNQLGLAAVKFALQHKEWIDNNINKLKMEREILFAALEDIENIKVFASEANFLTVRVPNAQVCFDTLLESGFLIKNLHNAHPMLANCVRITIGKPEDNAAILKIFRKLYE